MATGNGSSNRGVTIVDGGTPLTEKDPNNVIHWVGKSEELPINDSLATGEGEPALTVIPSLGQNSGGQAG